MTAQSPPGTPIPSSRELARELGIARNTVLNAVEQLRAEGYLQGERGSGTYVNDVLPEDLSRARPISGSVCQPNGKRQRLSARATHLAATRLPQLPAGLPKPFRPAALAATEGVETVPLSSFYATQSKRSGLVLGFAAFDEREIHVGVQKLARALALLKRE